jgi:hypothetical protein
LALGLKYRRCSCCKAAPGAAGGAGKAAAPHRTLLVGQGRDSVAFLGDLFAQVFDREIRQVVGAILHFESALFYFPIRIRRFFRNGFAFRYGQVREFAVMFGTAIDVNAHNVVSYVVNKHVFDKG